MQRGSRSSVDANISHQRGIAEPMSKDRTSAKTTPSEVPLASQPSAGAEPIQSESLKRLKAYALPRRIQVLTVDEGKALLSTTSKAGWKPMVRQLGYGISIRLGGYEVVSEV